MANLQTFTNDDMVKISRHNDRSIIEDRNADIDPNRTYLNYSFELDHGGQSYYRYYKKIVNESYLYGRGTKREKKAIVACSWVVTAPKEIVGNQVKEDDFFQGTFEFLSERYGGKENENVLQCDVHYDEAGAPHMHFIFCPVTEIDHEKIHFKTDKKTKEIVRLESGRYEIHHPYLLDENGQKIAVKNYARMSDYFEKKVSANDVINKIELKKFHGDFQKYLDDHGIEGRVMTGKTGGISFSVEQLKEFTEKTGLHLEDVQKIQGDLTILESLVQNHSKVNSLEEILSEKNAVIDALKERLIENSKAKEVAHLQKTIQQKNDQIRTLQTAVEERNQQIEKAININKSLQNKTQEMQKEIDRANERIQELEKAKNREKEKQHEWGRDSSGWGTRTSSSEWGRLNNTIDEEKTW